MDDAEVTRRARDAAVVVDCFYYRVRMLPSQLQAFGVRVLDDGSLQAPSRRTVPPSDLAPSPPRITCRDTADGLRRAADDVAASDTLWWVGLLLERVVSEAMGFVRASVSRVASLASLAERASAQGVLRWATPSSVTKTLDAPGRSVSRASGGAGWK